MGNTFWFLRMFFEAFKKWDPHRNERENWETLRTILENLIYFFLINDYWLIPTMIKCSYGTWKVGLRRCHIGYTWNFSISTQMCLSLIGYRDKLTKHSGYGGLSKFTTHGKNNVKHIWSSGFCKPPNQILLNMQILLATQ